MSVDDPIKANALREEGNALYKAGKLIEAAKLYQNASELAPSDSAPLSNLSAACFELGRYPASIKFGKQAYDLLKPEDVARKAKLRSRLARSYIHLRLFDQADKWLSVCARIEDAQGLKEAVRQQIDVSAVFPDEAACRAQILNALPRYKPVMQDVPEYYSFGHDDAFPLFDKSLHTAVDDLVSIMFCGIGDARNFYATITAIEKFESGVANAATPSSKQRYHFTLVDLKPAVLARNLIMLNLLTDLAEVDSNDKNASLLLLATIFYTFGCSIMPSYAYARLQMAISKVIDTLDGTTPASNWIWLSSADKVSLAAVLRQWQTEVPQKYPISELRRLAVEQNRKTRLRRMMTRVDDPTTNFDLFAPAPCKRELACFQSTGLLFPPGGLLAQSEPELLALIDNYDARKRTHVDRDIATYLDSNWKSNVTMVDLDWENNRDDHADLDVGFNPFELGQRLYKDSGVETPSKVDRLFDFAIPFFTRVAIGIKRIQDRTTLEIIYGEMADVLERIRHGLLEHRQEKVHVPAPQARKSRRSGYDSPPSVKTELPTRYDRIHMSNIPDYVGGSLTSFLYGVPLTKDENDKKTSYILSNVLRNPDQFPDPMAYNCEYLLAWDPEEVALLLGTTAVPHQPAIADPAFTCGVHLMSEYFWWQKIEDGNVRLPLKDLLPRARVERWLYAHFFKLIIPKDRDTLAWSLINAPLNVTVFFRILCRLWELGYPAHWLSDVLDNIITSNVSTTARPPRTSPMSKKEVDKVYPERKLSTAPFQAEVSTLTAMWLRILPFGITTSGLPRHEDIGQYSVQFTRILGSNGLVPAFMLVFTSAILPSARSIRNILLDDEKGDQSAEAKDIRENKLHVLTTFKWVTKKKQASFYMRKDVMAKIVAEGWKCYVWRTDNYMAETEGVLVSSIKEIED